MPEVSFVAGCYLCESLSARGTIELSSFRADIRDDYVPSVSAVRGSLASNLSHAGVETVEFDVSDIGTGIYRAVAEARLLGRGDWVQLSTTPLGMDRPSCRELDVTPHPYEFDDPQPCPLAVSKARVDFDADSLPIGEHEFRLVVEDASGNRRSVITPRKFFAKSSGTAASALVPGGRSVMIRIAGAVRRTAKAGEPIRLRGSLTEVDGRPLPSVSLTVRSRPFLPKPGVATGDWTVLGHVTTGADGSYSVRIPAGTSRTVQVMRESGEGIAEAAASTDVAIPASVSARARSTRIRNGQSAVFTGQVTGPIPSGGVLVVLEVREPGRWIPVATTRRWVRTSASGRFRLAYRFRRTFQPATYRFRVAAVDDSAFAYTRGVSRTIDVRVKP